MEPKELRAKNMSELEHMLYETREKSRKLYFDLAAGRVKDVKEASSLRRDIARLKTILKEKNVQ